MATKKRVKKKAVKKTKKSPAPKKISQKTISIAVNTFGTKAQYADAETGMVMHAENLLFWALGSNGDIVGVVLHKGMPAFAPNMIFDAPGSGNLKFAGYK